MPATRESTAAVSAALAAAVAAILAENPDARWLSPEASSSFGAEPALRWTGVNGFVSVIRYDGSADRAEAFARRHLAGALAFAEGPLAIADVLDRALDHHGVDRRALRREAWGRFRSRSCPAPTDMRVAESLEGMAGAVLERERTRLVAHRIGIAPNLVYRRVAPSESGDAWEEQPGHYLRSSDGGHPETVVHALVGLSARAFADHPIVGDWTIASARTTERETSIRVDMPDGRPLE